VKADDEAFPSVVWPDTVRVDAVVVARVDVAVTVSTVVVAELAKKLVDDANDDVRLVNAPVIAVKRLAKKLDEVAFVVDAFVAKKLDDVALVRLAFVEKRLVTVPTVVDEVLSTVLPDTVRSVADAVARLV
jgi:hypothetical protein